MRGEARLDLAPKDTGCPLHPSCLRCPLPICRHDEIAGERPRRNRERDREIAELHRQGVNRRALAMRFGISVRAIHHVVRKAKEDGR